MSFLKQMLHGLFKSTKEYEKKTEQAVDNAQKKRILEEETIDKKTHRFQQQADKEKQEKELEEMVDREQIRIVDEEEEILEGKRKGEGVLYHQNILGPPPGKEIPSHVYNPNTHKEEHHHKKYQSDSQQKMYQ
ncbi:hypothetical protein GOV08_05655 [Candidatus Woesearchaeota archaeon]|nr:hypothetical protein [Candidatus Woesearchaeota archaeon]